MKSFETAPQTHLKQQKDTIQTQIPLPSVSPIKASFVLAQTIGHNTQAGEREQYSREEQNSVSLSWLLLDELSLKYGEVDRDKQIIMGTELSPVMIKSKAF